MRFGAGGGDARRLLLARFVLEHRLEQRESLNIDALRWEVEATDLVLADAPVSFARATALLTE
jgi:acyl-CoA dehydrogenase